MGDFGAVVGSLTARREPLSFVRLLLVSVGGFVGAAVGLVGGLAFGLAVLSEQAKNTSMPLVFALAGAALGVTAFALPALTWRRRMVGDTPASASIRPAAALPESVCPDDDPRFVAACAHLMAKGEPNSKVLLLGVLMVALFFVGDLGKNASVLISTAMLVGVLVLHELGHLIAMRAYGFRDVRIFFIPGFGALTTGMKNTAPASQRAVISMMGPLPGIVIALVLFASGMTRAHPLMRELAWLFLGLNAFNLLPIVPLDGGQFMLRTLFSRSPSAGVWFSVFGGVVLAALAILTKAWLFIFIAAAILRRAPMRHREAKLAREIAAELPEIPPVLENAPKPFLYRLYSAIAEAIPEGPHAAAHRAISMRSLHELLAAPPTTSFQRAFLLTLYGGTFLLTLVTIVVGALAAAPR